MSNAEHPAGRPAAFPGGKVLIALIAGAVALFALWIAKDGRPVSIRYGDGAIELGADPELGALLDTARAKNPRDFAALLGARGFHDAVTLDDHALALGANPELGLVLDAAGAQSPDALGALLSARGFYSVSSPRLVDALRQFDIAKEANLPVTVGLRQLLWDLGGPFDGKELLSQADARFMQALTAIDRPIRPDDKNGALIIELWKRGLERDSPLGLRLFNARVVPVRANADGAPLVWFCPGLNDTLGDKYASIFLPGSPTAVEGVLTEDDRQRLDCGGAPTRLRDLFAGAPLVLGVDPSQYARLAAEADVSTGGAISATFEVQPSRHIPAATETAAAD